MDSIPSLRYKFSDAQLAEAVKNSLCVRDVLRLIGASLTSGGVHNQISRRIKKLGLDTSHFLPYGAGLRPNHVSKNTYVPPQERLVRRPPGSGRENSFKLRRALLAVGTPYQCAECGIYTWRGKPLPLEIEHRDGDPLNNEISNLCFLCPNCHSQTATDCRQKGLVQTSLWKNGY